MLLKKVTIGFVVQTFNMETGKFVSQDFVAGDQVSWETDLGEPAEDRSEYLNFDMVQPE